MTHRFFIYCAFKMLTLPHHLSFKLFKLKPQCCNYEKFLYHFRGGIRGPGARVREGGCRMPESSDGQQVQANRKIRFRLRYEEREEKGIIIITFIHSNKQVYNI